MVQNIDEITYSFIKKSLDATSERSRVIAHNVANFNTQGYKASRVIFEEKLNDVINNNTIGLKVTHERHISDGSSVSNISHETVKDNSSSMRLDGNNVDIDKEMTGMAANTILYNTLITQANSRISMRRYVTSEGRR